MWLRRPYRLTLLLVLILWTSPPTGQVSKFLGDDLKKARTKGAQPDKKTSEFTFKVRVNTVVVPVKATDAEGKPVRDLRAEDFKIQEDGKVQAIQTFAVEDFKGYSTKSLAASDRLSQSPAVPAVLPKRFIKLLIDDVTETSPLDVLSASKAIEQLMATGTQTGDLFSFATTSGSAEVPFTPDTRELVAKATTLYKTMHLKGQRRLECPPLSDYQAQMITTDRDPEALAVAIADTMACTGIRHPTTAERLARSMAQGQFGETRLRNRNLLDAVEQNAKALRHLEGSKFIILLSGGFLSHELHAELENVIDASLRSGVVVHTIDIRGLYTTNSGASEQGGGDPGRLRLGSSEMSLKQDPLNQLANETGGVFFHNNNDLLVGLRQIIENESHRYILTYSSPAPPADGRYHKIKVEVVRPGTSLKYRKGYYAQKEQLTYERQNKKDLLEALQSTVEFNEIPIQLSYEYLRTDAGSFELELDSRVAITKIPFVDEEQRRKNVIHLVVVVFDENDSYVTGLEKTIALRLTDAGYEALRRQGLLSKAAFNVPPGRYKIKAAVRESVRQQMGSLQRTIEVR
jgi:VWFA-related protein